VVGLARGLVGVPMEEEQGAGDGGPEPRPRLVAMQVQADPSDEAGAAERSLGGDKRRYSDALMLPEWMSDVPADVARSWLMLPRPAGQRCLVVSANGQTTARRRNGAVLARFPSALPGGRRAGPREQHGGAPTFCVLDCIFDAQTRTYHVLDVMVWRGYMLYDCHAQFRLYWVHTKLGEVDAAVASRTNPCPFLPVPYYEVSRSSLSELYAAAWPFVRGGLLFVHRETVYEQGASPLLLLWTDKACSERFFDFGSAEMEKEVARAPAKAEKWKDEMREAAVSFVQLLAAVGESEAACEAAGSDGASDGLASVSAARGARTAPL